jgi:hypothetical protein
VILRPWFVVTAIVLAALVTGLPATSASSRRVGPPDHAYSLVLPAEWHLDGNGDRSRQRTDTWSNPKQRLALLQISWAACPGCTLADVTTFNLHSFTGNADVGKDVTPNQYDYFTLSTSITGDSVHSGLVLMTSRDGTVTGYWSVDLLSPQPAFNLARSIDKSFRLVTGR